MAATWPQTLWLVRHGESVGNVAAAAAAAAGEELVDLTGDEDAVDLSPRGEQQAAALGAWLKALPPGEAPEVVISSPYLRARRTAAVALEAAGFDLPVSLDERLRDRDQGILDRLTARGVAARFPDQADQRRRIGKFYHRAPGGESWADVALRLRAVLTDLRQNHGGRRVMVFTHDVVVILFRYLIEGLDARTAVEVGRATPVRNGGLTMYRLHPGGREGLVLERFNAEVDADGRLVTDAAG